MFSLTDFKFTNSYLSFTQIQNYMNKMKFFKIKLAKVLLKDSVVNMILNPVDYTELFICYQSSGIILYNLEVIVCYLI